MIALRNEVLPCYLRVDLACISDCAIALVWRYCIASLRAVDGIGSTFCTTFPPFSQSAEHFNCCFEMYVDRCLFIVRTWPLRVWLGNCTDSN